MEAFKLVVAQKDGTADVFASCIAAKKGLERHYRIGHRTYGYKGTPVLVFGTLESAERFVQLDPGNMKEGLKVILRGEVPGDAEVCRCVTFPEYGREGILAFWQNDIYRAGSAPRGFVFQGQHLSTGNAPVGTLAAKWFKPLEVVQG